MANPPIRPCSICTHEKRDEIDALLRTTAPGHVVVQLAARGVVVSVDALRRHRTNHLGLIPFGRNRVLQIPAEKTPEDLGHDARKVLSVRLHELEAKDLLTLSVESMRLERAKIEAGSKTKPPDAEPPRDGDEAAVADFERARRLQQRAS